jgi:diadenosine tetraphosphatase ApaH/serine/threonine PP2A family protein phosphatase
LAAARDDSQRVVVTGLGINCCLGSDVASFWSGLEAGRSGITNWRTMDPRVECRVAGDPSHLKHLPELDALEALQKAVSPEHADFLRSFIDTFRFGDYLFVHAGIRPGVDLAVQSQRDLRWIRAAFLDHPSDHGFLVVHGHTISADVDERTNRIGIDTGAYATGILTAIAVEDDRRWFLSTDTAQSEQTASLVD